MVNIEVGLKSFTYQIKLKTKKTNIIFSLQNRATSKPIVNNTEPNDRFQL